MSDQNTKVTEKQKISAKSAEGVQHAHQKFAGGVNGNGNKVELKQQDDGSAEIPCAPPKPKKLAARIVDIGNYFGAGFVLNSALSLFITYKAMPTAPAQKFIGGLKGVARPIASSWINGKETVRSWFTGKKNITALNPESIENSARSFVEICCMLIAGFCVLPVMKYVEDHKKWFVDKVDHVVGKKETNGNGNGHGPEEEFAGGGISRVGATAIDPDLLHPRNEETEPKLTWGKLIKARMIGVGTVLGIDAGLQMFNNRQMAKEARLFDAAEVLTAHAEGRALAPTASEFAKKLSTGDALKLLRLDASLLDHLPQVVKMEVNAAKKVWNLDKAEWDMGGWIFKNVLPEPCQKWFTNFFNRNGSGLGSIQPGVQKRLFTEPGAQEVLDIGKQLAHMNEEAKLNPELMKTLEARSKPLLDIIENHPTCKRIVGQGIFKEQTRLFTKEVSLTLVMAGIVFALSKFNPIKYLTGKKEEAPAPEAPPAVSAAEPVYHAASELQTEPRKKFTPEHEPASTWETRENARPHASDAQMMGAV